MKRLILNSILIIIPIVSFAGNRDSLRDNKVYFSAGTSLSTLIELEGRNTFLPASVNYATQVDWFAHHEFGLNLGLEWRNWSVSYANGLITGRMSKNFLFENVDQAISTLGSVREYQNVYTEMACSNWFLQIGIGRVFHLPRTRINVHPSIGVRLNYTTPKEDEFTYWGLDGDHSYDIDRVEVHINEVNEVYTSPFANLVVSHEFSFGEMGFQGTLSTIFFDYVSDFYTNRAYAFTDSGFLLNYRNYLSLGFFYKLYFNK